MYNRIIDEAIMESRNLRHNEVIKPSLLIESDMLGTRNLIANISVYGAIIMSTSTAASNLELTTTWRDDVSSYSNRTLTATEVAAARLSHARNMIKELPFPVVEWPPVFAGPCPQIRNGHRTERGLAFAHYQIWLDFVFFDHDVLLAVDRKDIKESYSSTTFSSIGTIFIINL